MTDDFDDPKIAKEALNAIMEAFPKKKIAEFFGDFNQLGVFIDRQIAKEKK